MFDAATFQAAVTAAVTAAMASINTNTNGNGGTNSSTNGATPGQSRGCTYKDFTNAKPPTFRGDGGIISLTRWFEKIESVFEICVCPEELKVKYAACTFADTALSWWNGHVKTMTLTIANSMSWEELKTMLLEEYCPRSEMQKLESELWNLTMKGSDINAYTNRFNELAVLCPAMVTPESTKVERYIWGLPSPIQGHVESSNPVTFDSAKRLAHRLVAHAIRQGKMSATPDHPRGGDKKKRTRDYPRGQFNQGPAKKQQVVAVRAATIPVAPVTQAPPKQYSGTLPKCNKCNFHHNGPCRELICHNCNKKGHTTRYCRAPAQQTAQATTAGASQTCYGCGKAGHFKRN